MSGPSANSPYTLPFPSLPSLCSNLFSPDTFFALSLSGAGAGCVWATNYLLIVRIGAGATLLPGDNITMAGPNTAYSTVYTDAWRVTTPLLLSDEVLPPVAVLAASGVTGRCTNVTIDARGSFGGGGRQLVYRWAVSTSGTSLPSGVCTVVCNSCVRLLCQSVHQNSCVSRRSVQCHGYSISCQRADNRPASHSLCYSVCRLSQHNLDTECHSYRRKLPQYGFCTCLGDCGPHCQ